MRWTIGLLAALALLLSATNAQADWKIDRAQAIAEHAWHYNYGCDQGVTIRWADPERAFGHEALTGLRSNLHEPLAWTFPTAADRCVVYFNAPWEQRWGLGFTEICSAMIHEYGHLAGHGHSLNPRSIMYEDYRADRRCRKRGRPYLMRYGLLT